MNHVCWSHAAANDVDRIAEYLFEQTPLHAPRLVREILTAARSLETFPLRGRQGRRQGTRELVLAPLPYLIVYGVRRDTVLIFRVLHGAQKWP